MRPRSLAIKSEYKYMRLVALVYVTLLLSATVSSYRIIQFGTLQIPGSTFFYAFSFFWANIFTEIYGAENSKRLIIETILCGYIFALSITLINHFPAPSYWNNKVVFASALGHILRFTVAGNIGYLSSAFSNVYFSSRLKFKIKSRYFWLRNLAASSLSEGVATFVAGLLTFFGMLPAEKILLVMGDALLFKLALGFLAVWPASFVAFLLKKVERIDDFGFRSRFG